jgi:hypothetical protein
MIIMNGMLTIRGAGGRIYERIESLDDWFQDRATRLFGWAYRKPVNGPEQFEFSNGETVSVYWFSRESSLLGQVTPFNTVLLNKTILSQVSRTTKEYVMRHELSHRDRNPIFRGLWLGLILTGIIGIVAALLFVLALMTGVPLYELTELGLFSVLTVASGILANRGEETLAELEALHAVGVDDFRDARQEVESVVDSTILTRVLGKLFYPPPDQTVHLYRLLCHIGLCKKTNRWR